MTELPEITEVQRLRLNPGDSLVVKVPNLRDDAQIQFVKQRVRAVLSLPLSVPILVLPAESSVEVLEAPGLPEAVRLATQNPGHMIRVSEP